MLVAAIILVLYFWAYFAVGKSIGSTFFISDAAAILAGTAFAVGFASYLWAPKKYVFWGALGAYTMLCATTALLIITTGGTSSPFLALWMTVSAFAGVFGFYAILPLFVAITGYLIFQFSHGTLTREAIIAVVLAGELPLLASYIIWHNKATNDTTAPSDKAYQELASELSQVAGKAEVVINAIADGVIALNSQGIIQLINPAAEQIIGWGRQDALSLDYKSVLKLTDKNNQDLTPANDPISQTLATNKEVVTNNLSLTTKSGKKLLVSVIVSPVGQLGDGVIVVFRDITKEKAEEREQAEFISTASHEMRTPVASIEGYLGLALNPATAQIDDKARDFINKAHQSAEHLGRLFQDLLDVSKAEDGRLANNPKVVDVVAFIHDIVQGLEPEAKEKGLRVLFKPQPDDSEDQSGERRLNPVFYVNVDNDHLREVVANLVENAIKYTPGGEIVIDVTGDTEHVIISVADSGIGIPKEDMAHLFQKFYRVDNSETREIGGTGLGLYLCRRLTEAMNGRIWVDSEYKRGSTFYVELPRTSHEEAQRLIEAASIKQEEKATLITPFIRPQVAKPTFVPQPAPPPMPQPQSAPGEEAVYTSAPIETVVQHLESINPQPTPVQLQPIAPSQRAYAPSQTYVSPHLHENVPLTSIERNPQQYIRTRPDGVPVPPRDQD